MAAILDFHGLAGRPAGTRVDVAARHGITPPTLRVWTDRVADAGARLPLPPVVVTAALRRSHPDQGHLGRTRIAETLGLAPPKPPAVAEVTLQPAGIPVAGAPVARAAVRLLATVGPLDPDCLLAAVNRQRRLRRPDPVDGRALAAALRRAGVSVDETGRWCPVPGLRPPDRYRAIAAIAEGRDLTRHDMIRVLTDAGYTPASAEGISARHPLFRRIGPDRYRMIAGP